MSIEVEYEDQTAMFVVAPAYGRTVVFEVRRRHRNRSEPLRFVVGLKGSDREGFSAHLTFDKACRSALYRARRYQKAYSKPHGVQARAMAEAS